MRRRPPARAPKPVRRKHQLDTDVGGGRFVSVSTWESREQAELATEKAAQWVSENLADSVSLEENLIGEMTTLGLTATRV